MSFPEFTARGLTADFLNFSEKDRSRSIPARFEKIARTVPDSPAVLTLTQSISYAKLNQAANRIADAIRARCGVEPEPILSLAHFGAESIAHLLGVFKAGKIFVSLDPAFPAVRHRRVLADTQARFILTNEKYRHQALKLIGGDERLIVLEDPFSDDPLNYSNDPNRVDKLGESDRFSVGESVVSDSSPPDVNPINAVSIAGIFYTSGSTGEPKGVLASHGTLLARIALDREAYGTGPGDRQPLVYSLSFQASMTDILGALLNGGAVCPLNLKARQDISFEKWLRDIRVTILRTSVSIFRRLLDDLPGPGSLPDVRITAVGGAKLFPRDYAAFRSLFPGARLMHRLAASETGLITRCEIDDDLLPQRGYYPTGWPVPGVQVTIVDDTGRTLPTGEVGEIAVTSGQMSPGYWRQPEKTLEKFIPNHTDPLERTCYTGDLGRILPDGALHHLGRVDFMVKVRGYRVEIPEIESALFSLDSIKQAVVMAHPDSIGEEQLVAYCIPAGGQKLSISDIRSALSASFPEYMIPARLVVMDRFPMNPSTKVDRRALAPPGRERPDLKNSYSPSSSELEKTLAEIWAEVLNLDRVGVEDHFLDLGGNSLLAMRVTSRIAAVLEIDIPLSALLDQPTIALMAESIAAFQASMAPASDLDALLESIEALSDEEIESLLGD